MPAANRRLTQWVVGFWLVNFLCASLLAIFWLVSLTGNPVAAGSSSLPTPPPSTPSATPLFVIASPLDEPPTPLQPATATLIPTFTPTLTLTPTATPPPTATLEPSATPDYTPTLTPVPFASGPIVIGHSVAGRPLEVYRFGNGSTRRMIVAGIHGGSEANTIELANELIAYIEDHPEIIPRHITLYILPSLNPDGAARGRGPIGRTNENGVDLNRNWPHNWQASWDRNGCWTLLPVTAGDYPASEPEVLALMMFIQYHNIDALISYHSAALGIFAGGYDYGPSVRLAEAVAEVSTYPWPPIDTGCEITGDLTDWAAAQRIAAIDIELSDHTHTDFDQNLDILRVFLNWRR